MDYSDAESHFFRQQNHRGAWQSVLLLYEQLRTLVKSVQYILLQVIEEIQRQHLQFPAPPEHRQQLMKCYGQLQACFEQTEAAPGATSAECAPQGDLRLLFFLVFFAKQPAK